MNVKLVPAELHHCRSEGLQELLELGWVSVFSEAQLAVRISSIKLQDAVRRKATWLIWKHDGEILLLFTSDRGSLVLVKTTGNISTFTKTSLAKLKRFYIYNSPRITCFYIYNSPSILLASSMKVHQLKAECKTLWTTDQYQMVK